MLDKISISIVIGSYLFLGTFFLIILIVKYKENNKHKKEFFATLNGAFEHDLINSIDDIIQLYLGIYRNTSNYEGSIQSLLREYSVRLINENEKTSQLTLTDRIIKEYIKELERREPFSFLPAIEKKGFSEILDYCKSSNVSAIEDRIKDISHILKGKNETIEKISRSNRFSIPIAIAGIILTIFFGIASIK